MTRDRMDCGMNSETSSIPEEFSKNATVEDHSEANCSWSDNIVVKSEVIILPDESLPAVQCRLCHSTDHLCSPVFNLGGGCELTEAHFETIYRLSDIIITYEKDHASVVCSYCLLKIEEFTTVREVWQMQNNIAHESKVPAIEPPTTIAPDLKDASTQTTTISNYQIKHIATDLPEDRERATKCEPTTIAPDLKDASTQTTTISNYQIKHIATDLPEDRERAAKCEPTSASAPVAENNIIAVDGKESSTQCEIIDVEEYCVRSEGERKRRRSKIELIEEVMQLVKKQYRSKPLTKNRPSC